MWKDSGTNDIYPASGLAQHTDRDVIGILIVMRSAGLDPWSMSS